VDVVRFRFVGSVVERVDVAPTFNIIIRKVVDKGLDVRSDDSKRLTIFHYCTCLHIFEVTGRHHNNYIF
jgi:hypothetical protein